MTVTILLADDHPIIRQGLLRLLDAEPGMKVVGEASDGLEAVQMAERLRPAILVIDMMMPGLNGLEALRQIRKRSPATINIVLSMQSADAYVMEALRSGASGYVLKDSGPAEVVTAIRQVLQGDRFLSPGLEERVLNAGTRNSAPASLDLYETLTDREREVLQMAAEGRSSTEIGEKLVISPRTVEIHRGRVMKKLGLRNQADLIRYAIRRGIIPMDQ